MRKAPACWASRLQQKYRGTGVLGGAVVLKGTEKLRGTERYRGEEHCEASREAPAIVGILILLPANPSDMHCSGPVQLGSAKIGRTVVHQQSSKYPRYAD